MATNGIPAVVEHVLNTLQTSGYEAVLVGGCVRDMLLSRTVQDYDVATNAQPKIVQQLFQRTKDIGIVHGTVTVLDNPTLPVEVTTYRTDASYSDGRHPDQVVFGASLDEDLARRDFTINAMALTTTGELIDPYGGLDDIHARILRAVGKPHERFSEDSLRILRGLRFAAELTFTINPITYRAMEAAAPKLSHINSARTGQEISKIVRAPWWNILELIAAGPFFDQLPQPLPRIRSYLNTLHQSQPYDHDGWQTYLPVMDARVHWLGTWATWLTLCTSPLATTQELFRVLAYNHRDVAVVGLAAQLAREELENQSAKDWQNVLFINGALSVQIAARVRDGLGKSKQRPCTEIWNHYCQVQPLWSRADLAIKGADLHAYGYHGKAVGQVIQTLCQAVLTGTALNTKQSLRQFLHKE